MKSKSLLNMLCALLSAFLAVPISAHAQVHLVFASLPDKRPATLIAQSVLTQAYKQIDVDVKFEELPNSRVLMLVQTHAVDGLTYRIVDNPLLDLQKVAVPISSESFVVYALDPSLKINGYAGLKPYSIGYLAGARIFEERLKNMRIETAPNLESLFRKLDAKRTDLVIESRSSYCQVKKLGLNNIVMIDASLESPLAYHWISERHADLIPKLEAVLEKMRKNGSMKKIHDEVWAAYNKECDIH